MNRGIEQDQGFILVPIAIREGEHVRIHFPADITAEEAEKVARVIKAFAETPKGEGQ